MDTAANERTPKMAPAGLLARCCAGVLDLCLIGLVVVAVAEVLTRTGRYLPIEITVIMIYAVYTAILITLFGVTLGGRICGVLVIGLQNERLSLLHTLVRAVAVALPYIHTGSDRPALGQAPDWHDRSPRPDRSR